MKSARFRAASSEARYMNFTPTDFTYDFSSFGSVSRDEQVTAPIPFEELYNLRYSRGYEAISKACEILNTLTEEQKKAVELFGRARYKEGVSDEMSSNSE